MKRAWSWSVALAALALAAVAGPAIADETGGDFPVQFKQRDMSGPRLGVTTVTGNGELWKDLDKEGIGRMISQFGWHFERQIVPRGGGPQFVIEGIPMIGGVEYGKVIPSATFAMGVRFPSGNEFGMGPNVIATPRGGLKSALVIAIGRSFDYGGVSLPVNLVLATNPKGQRASVIIGYAIQRTPYAVR
jgi:hypothetical protein